MSFTGFSSIIYNLDTDKQGIKINDLNGLFNYMEKEKIPMTALMTDDKIEDKKEYPHKVYKYLYGFSSYEDDKQFYLFERLGYDYSKEDFIKFWENISKYCEPFYFYHLPYDTCIPKTVFDVLHEGEETVYKVVCVNGKVEVHCFNIFYKREKI